MSRVDGSTILEETIITAYFKGFLEMASNAVFMPSSFSISLSSLRLLEFRFRRTSRGTRITSYAIALGLIVSAFIRRLYLWLQSHCYNILVFTPGCVKLSHPAPQYHHKPMGNHYIQIAKIL